LKLIQQLREQSTINGYEGTGRSLSFEQSTGKTGMKAEECLKETKLKSRNLKEVKLEEPIRYSINDSVEAWLNKILCLDCTPSSSKSKMASGCPHPSKCELYYVTRGLLKSLNANREAVLSSYFILFLFLVLFKDSFNV
jgi:N-acetyltransferase 10